MGDVDPDCARCRDTGWVCEAHDDRPWVVDGAAHCDAPGVPCPDCNPSDGRGDPPDVRRIMERAPEAESH